MLRLGWMQHNGAGGYSRVGEQMRLAIKRTNAAHVLDYTDWQWDACVQVSPPRATTIGPHLRPDLILHTMIECDRIPDGWADLINRTGVLWVPSTYARNIFLDGGVTIPILKTPYGIAPEWEYVDRTPGPFRVLAWGDTLSSRKNIEAVIKAFIAADIPGAILEVKLQHPLMPDHSLWEGRENVIVWNGEWKDWELRKWLATGHVGVYVSSGEGYGLMPKEMMATGLPLIAMINTGLTEYMRSDLIFEVESARRPSAYWKRIFGFEVDEPYPVLESLVEQLREAHRSPETLYMLGVLGSEHVRSYTWDATAQTACAFFRQHYGVTS